MDWKKENPKSRYIDDIKWEEAKKIAFLAAGKPEDFELEELKAECNGNNIPHVKLFYRYYEPILGNGETNFIGIFHNLNTYLGRGFGSVYCQVELFKAFDEMKFD
jgi:hypothetical protein